jgi:hypothetical protein
VALDLVADEVLREADVALDRVVDTGLLGDREVVANLLEEAAGRLREVAAIAGEALDRALAGGEDAATRLRGRDGVGGGVDRVLDFDEDLAAEAVQKDSRGEWLEAARSRGYKRMGYKRGAPRGEPAKRVRRSVAVIRSRHKLSCERSQTPLGGIARTLSG